VQVTIGENRFLKGKSPKPSGCLPVPFWSDKERSMTLNDEVLLQTDIVETAPKSIKAEDFSSIHLEKKFGATIGVGLGMRWCLPWQREWRSG
jgi:hypothetical protein